MIACNYEGTHKVSQLWLFYQLPQHVKCTFSFSSYCDVTGSDKLRRRLINIYDELVWNVVLKDYIGNFVKNLGSHFSPKRHGNYWPWCSDRAMWKSHPLVQRSSPWSCHFKIHILAESFWVVQIKPFSTPETTWMLITAPAVCRYTSIEGNLRSSTSYTSNGWPLTHPIFDFTLVSHFFFCSCMSFLWLFTHGGMVLLFKYGNFSWNLVLATETL